MLLARFELPTRAGGKGCKLNIFPGCQFHGSAIADANADTPLRSAPSDAIDGSAPQLPKRSARPEQLEQSEFLANPSAPDGDVEGVLYVSMRKPTNRAPTSHTGKKSYLVPVTVPAGGEKFQFVFPPKSGT